MGGKWVWREVLCLAVALAELWPEYCTVDLQDLTIAGMGEGQEGSLWIIVYNCM